MRKHDNFTMLGYKYAPEQWQYFYNGKLLSLTEQEHSTVRMIQYQKGWKAATDELKRIIRKRQKHNNRYATIGFYGIEHNKEFYFTKQLLAKRDNLQDMLQVYKEWKEYILNMNCQLPFCTTGKLDGNFNTIEKKTEYNTVDINRPLIVNLRMV